MSNTSTIQQLLGRKQIWCVRCAVAVNIKNQKFALVGGNHSLLLVSCKNCEEHYPGEVEQAARYALLKLSVELSAQIRAAENVGLTLY